MRRSRLVSICVITAVCGLLMMSGCSSTAATAPSAGGSAASNAPSSGSAVNLVDYADNDGTKSTVILTGAIGDYGEAVSVRPDGAVDPEHGSELKLTLTQGSFRIDITNLDKKLVSAFSHFPSDVSTCSGTVTASDAAPVVAGTGVGAYKGISGTFNLTVTIAEVDAKANCNGSGAFLRQAVVTAGPGKISLS